MISATDQLTLPDDPAKVIEVAIGDPIPSPENDTLYRPARSDDPEIRELARSMARHGQREPILMTADRYVVSGHRRLCAAKLARFSTIKARIEQYRRGDDPDHHVLMLRECNRQRDKSNAEKSREEIVSADPEEAHRVVVEHRRAKAEVDAETIVLGGRKARSEFNAGTMAFVEQIKGVLEANRRFLPFSLRRLHYLLVSEETWRFKSSNRQTRYENDRPSYKSLSDVTTRMRLAGMIPFGWISDETRPEHYCRVYNDPRAFLREELSNFGKGYYRDLMQSQPLHFHIHAEKNTLLPIINDVADEYTIRVTSGRGFTSIPPRKRIEQQFRRSGKDGLVLLMLSDFDPEGECIVETFARSLRDDFGIKNIKPIKVGLTEDQKDMHELPPMMKAKTSSSRYAGFVEKHGDDAWEIEALPADVLREELRDAIDSMVDVDAYNAEVDREMEDAAFLDEFRREWMYHARKAGADLGDGDE